MTNENIATAKRSDLVKACAEKFAHTSITNWLTFKNVELRSFLLGETQPEAEQTIKDVSGGDASIIEAIAGALNGKIKAGLDEEAVRSLVAVEVDTWTIQFKGEQDKMIADAIAKMPAREITVITPEGSKVKMGMQHSSFDLLLKLVGARLNVWLAGPAGSGKTQAAENAAKALELKFHPYSCGPQTSKTDMLGYMNAHGDYVGSVFRDAFEQGGVFLLDEVDAANPAILVMLNSAISNGYCSFADKVVNAHSDFVCIASGNTFGSGANRVYVGRSQIDAATTSRFFFVEWDYDRNLESFLSNDDEWRDLIWAARDAAEENKIRHVVGTRSILAGEQALAVGVSREEALEGCLWKGLDETARRKMVEGMKSRGITKIS